MKENKINAYELSPEVMEKVSGGLVVDDGDGQKFWLVRQDGTVISPVPGKDKAQEFAKAYSISSSVITKEEYRKLFGRDLKW